MGRCGSRIASCVGGARPPAKGDTATITTQQPHEPPTRANAPTTSNGLRVATRHTNAGILARGTGDVQRSSGRAGASDLRRCGLEEQRPGACRRLVGWWGGWMAGWLCLLSARANSELPKPRQ